MKVFLETERLLLRQFTSADAELLIELDSDPEVMRFLTDGKPTEAQLIRDDVLPRFLRYYQAYENQGFWAVVEKASGEFLGWFHLRPGAPDSSQGLELGYRFKCSAWGKGYATEGSRALLRVAFAMPEVKRVIAITMKPNVKSAHVMQKLGMRFERDFVETRFPGADKAAVQYAITRDEFQKQGS
ncbi:MAG: GNAT family N-acetyltransferase [Deltaproteobacteria bacterium]|nr:GNAT family N-acetyltransferase [Deltaproteobacteria bacterium]